VQKEVNLLIHHVLINKVLINLVAHLVWLNMIYDKRSNTAVISDILSNDIPGFTKWIVIRW
jgi:hypothetical protein